MTCARSAMAHATHVRWLLSGSAGALRGGWDGAGQRAIQPLLDGLVGVSAQAGAVEAALRRVVGWATWRLLGQGVLAVAGLVGVLWLA